MIFSDILNKHGQRLNRKFNVNWLYIHDTSATCTYIYHYEGYKQGHLVKGSGRATNVFVKEEGNWQLIHEHLSH